MTPFKPNYLPTTPLPNAITWKVKASTDEQEWGVEEWVTNTQFLQLVCNLKQ